MKRGFTLIEIMVAVGLFLTIMVIAMGSVVSIINANRKVSTMKTALDNFNFAMESMSRELRFGTEYTMLGIFGGDNGGGFNRQGNAVGFSFRSQDGHQVVYSLDGTTIVKSTDGGPNVPLTAPDVVVQQLDLNPDLLAVQPKVIIRVKGFVGAQPTTETSFALETEVSQRVLGNGS